MSEFLLVYSLTSFRPNILSVDYDLSILAEEEGCRCFFRPLVILLGHPEGTPWWPMHDESNAMPMRRVFRPHFTSPYSMRSYYLLRFVSL